MKHELFYLLLHTEHIKYTAMARYLDPKNDLTFKRISGEHLELCEAGAFTEAELAAYEKYWDIVRTEASALHDARVEGLTQGRAEGEHKKAVAVALQAIQMGLTVEDASKLSGLTVEQIQTIINPN